MTAKRITVTIPEELLDSVRARVGEGEMSAYVTEALRHRDTMDRLGELVDWLEEEYGPVTEEERERGRQRMADIERRRAKQIGHAQADGSDSTAAA